MNSKPQIHLNLSVNSRVISQLPIPFDTLCEPDWKDKMARLADRMSSDYMAAPWPARKFEHEIFLSGVMSKGNALTDEELMKKMPKKDQLHILTKKIA